MIIIYIAHPPNNISLDKFNMIDNKIISNSGIFQLDKQIKIIKLKINEIIEKIIKDEDVEIEFSFYDNAF